MTPENIGEENPSPRGGEDEPVGNDHADSDTASGEPKPRPEPVAPSLSSPQTPDGNPMDPRVGDR